MNIEILKACGVEYEEGLERFSGSRRLYEKYLKMLLSDPTYEEMRRAACEGDLQTAFEAGHKMKAFIGNLAIDGFYEKIVTLTNEFRSGIRRDYRPDFDRLDQEYGSILTAIKTE